jgi:membrane protein YqaA with SNARE-associated domain
MSISRTIGKKATKATVKHSAHGVVAKARRKPMRSATLLTTGALLGAAVGWLLGRKASPAAAPAP